MYIEKKLLNIAHCFEVKYFSYNSKIEMLLSWFSAVDNNIFQTLVLFVSVHLHYRSISFFFTFEEESENQTLKIELQQDHLVLNPIVGKNASVFSWISWIEQLSEMEESKFKTF